MTVSNRGEDSLPKIIFNQALQDGSGCAWKHLPTVLVLPCAVPRQLAHMNIVWEIVGVPQEPDKFAVQRGMNMTVALLQKLQKHIGFHIPATGHGSGSQGRLVKLDYATGIVNHFYSDADADKKQSLIDSIMGTKRKVQACPKELLAALKKLDPETASDFSFVERQLLNQIDMENRFKHDGPSEIQLQRLGHTPPELKTLVPYNADGHPLGSIQRKFEIKQYQAFYACQVLNCLVFPPMTDLLIPDVKLKGGA